jgi:hypothetical protein
MERLYVEPTKYSQEIKLDPDSRILEIRGKSYPENTFEFYAPVMKWLGGYIASSPSARTVLNMEIIYFNSSSSKFFFDFFDVIEEAADQGFDVEINWIYDAENENALEAGEDFMADFETLNFNLVKK